MTKTNFDFFTLPVIFHSNKYLNRKNSFLVSFCFWHINIELLLSYSQGKLVVCDWFQCSHRDVLLLEAGLLAVLVAPLGLLRRHSSYRYHDPVSFWLTRWLFFRLTFCTGVSKLASGDPAWYDLSGKTNHFNIIHSVLIEICACNACPLLFMRKSYTALCWKFTPQMIYRSYKTYFSIMFC